MRGPPGPLQETAPVGDHTPPAAPPAARWRTASPARIPAEIRRNRRRRRFASSTSSISYGRRWSAGSTPYNSAASRAGGVPSAASRRRGRQLAKALADPLQAVGIVLRHVVRHAADRGVHARAAQRFGIDHLPGRALHQVRTAQPHEAGAFHHDDAVAERRKIRAARDARPHHRRDLRDAQLAPHQRVVVGRCGPRRTVPGKSRPDRADSRPPNPPGRRSAGDCASRSPARAESCVIVSGHHAPAFTVASFATITAGRPSMRAHAR